MSAGLRPGELVAQRFEILAPLRSGGLSTVYKAQERRTGRVLALKLIATPDNEPGLRARFERELQILTRLSHPNIVECFGSGALGPEQAYVVLEWLEGEDLADLAPRSSLSLRHVLLLLEQVAEALGCAHRHGIIHRDVKPANIFVLRGEPGAPPRVKVLDFGVAKRPGIDDGLTRAGAILGTPAYMAPEQAHQATDVDARADLFSLGVVAFELLAGRLPWSSSSDLARLARILVERAPPLAEAAPGIPGPIASLVDGLLAPELEARIATAAEVSAVLRACLDALPAAKLDQVRGGSRADSGEAGRTATLQLAGAVAVTKDVPGPPEVEQLDDPLERTDQHQLPSRGDEHAGKEPTVLLALQARAPSEEGSERGDGATRLVARQLPSDWSAQDSTVALSLPEALRQEARVGLSVRARALEPEVRALSDVGAEDFAGTPPLAALSYVDHRPQHVLFGRVVEVERLRGRALLPLTSGRSAYTVVVGPAGFGKTHVRAEVARLVRAGPRAPHLFAGRAEEVLRTAPFSFLGRLLRAEVRLDGPRTASEVAERLLELIPAEPVLDDAGDRGLEEETGAVTLPGARAPRSGRPVRARRAPTQEERRRGLAAFLAEGLGLPAPEHPLLEAARREPPLLGEEVRRAFELVFERLALERGLVLLIDDAHALDPQSARVLARLLQPARSLPIGLVVFALPHFLERDTRHASPLAALDALEAEVMELLPLEPRAMRELTRSLAKSPLEGATLEQLVTRAGGNPLYLEHLVRALQSAELLRPGASGELTLVAQDEAPGSDRVPPTVAAALNARISLLEPTLQKALTAAAVNGEVFWAEAVAQSVEQPLDDTMVALDRLLVEGFVRRRASSRYPTETELEFTHAAVRSVALSRLERRRRLLFEARAAEYLARVGEREPAVLARHLAGSGDAEAAAQRFAEASSRSLAFGDASSAAQLADEGLALAEGLATADRVRLLELLERAALLSADPASGLEALAQLAQLSSAPEAHARLAERRSRMAQAAGRFEGARAEAEEARRIWAALARPDGVAQADLLAAEASEALGEGRTALRGFLAAQAGLTSADVALARARVACGLARVALASGDHRAAERRYRAALEAARSEGEPELTFASLLGLAEAARLSGDGERATELLAEASAEALGRERRLLLRVQRALVLAEEGRFEPATERLLAVLELAESEPELSRVQRACGLALGQLLRGPGWAEWTPARRALVTDALARALESATEAEPALAWALQLTLGHARALQGNTADARRTVAEVVARFNAEGALHGEEPPSVFFTAALVARMAGAPKAEVQRALEHAVSHLDSIAGRLDRAMRARYLERWLPRAVLDAASAAGLEVRRDASSGRVSVVRGA
jgi:predicted ATPase